MYIKSSGEAYVSCDSEGLWAFGNRHFENVVAYNEENGLSHIELKDKVNGSIFAVTNDSSLFSVWVNLKKYDGRQFKLKEWNVTEVLPGKLYFDLLFICVQIPLELRLSIRIVSGAPGWQQQLILKSEAEGLCVHGLSPIDYKFDIDGIQEIAYYMKGCKHQGCTAVDLANIPYEDYRLEASELGRVFIKSGRRATEDYLPYIFANSSRDKSGLFIGVQWSGHWFLDAKNELDATEIHKLVTFSAGPDEFMHTLESGKEFVSPVCYFGVFKGDTSDAAKAHRAFLENAVIPQKPFGRLPITYNAWYAMEEKISEAKLRKEADIAAALGVEFFIIDAGWYGGSNPEYSSNGNFSTGLGDWKEDRIKFPSGIDAFAGYIRSKDMKFGMWVEPERVDLRTFAEGSWKREWLSGNEKGEPYELRWEPHHSGWLCFGVPEVREWAKTWLSVMIEQYRLDWIKWDSNWWTLCKCGNHGHQEHDGEYSHVQGVYEVFEYLLNKYPDLTIESCAGGGTRMDTGIMQYAHVHWVDDESELPQRVRCHCSRLSYYMPQSCIYTFALPVKKSLRDYEEYADGNSEALKNRLDYEMRSRMMGVWGLGYNLGELSEAVLDVMKKNIDIYKMIREIVKEGCFYNLMPILELMRPDMRVVENDAYMSVLPDQSRAVVFVFKNLPSSMAVVRLKGLNESKIYRVREITGLYVNKSRGKALEETGFIPELEGNVSSAVYLIEAE